jgi:hypothetical protein
MDSADDAINQEWSMSVNGSDVAQTGSSYTYPSHNMEQGPGFMSETVDPGDAVWNDPFFYNPNPSEGIISGGQAGLEEYAEPFHAQLSPLGHEYDQQDTSNGGTGIPDMDLAADFSNTDSSWFQLDQPPWNSQFLRMGEYDSGTVAFVDSGESTSDQSSYGTCPLSWTSTQESAEHDIQPSMSDRGPQLQTVRNRYPQLTWEENCVAEGGLLMISEMIQKESDSRQRGGRKGPLPIQTARHAHKIRGLRACWNCRIHKIKASVL